MSGLIKRLIVAGTLIPAILFSIFQQPIILVLFLSILSFAGMREFVLFRNSIIKEIIEKKNHSEFAFPPNIKHYNFQVIFRSFLSSLGPILVYFQAFEESRRIQLLLSWIIISISILIVGAMFGLLPWDGNKNKTEPILDPYDLIGITMDIFGILYTGGCLSIALILLQRNQFIFLLTLTGNWASDGMALLFGKTLGPYKLLGSLHKVLSPNKTIEGGIGAVIGSILASIILKSFVPFFPNLSKYWIIPNFGELLIYGVVIGVLSIIGDLIESYIKRIAKVKDSGQFFASHGGVLDRIDGLLFTFPLIYACVVILQH